MSLWSDMQDKNGGLSHRQEDVEKIYHKVEGNQQDEKLFTGTYKNIQYEIYTSGKYPYIIIPYNVSISSFAGSCLVKFEKEGGGYYDLERISNSAGTNFTYFCNHDEDYVEGEHEGKQYILSELKSLAEKFIDNILYSEKKYQDYCMEND